MLLSKVTVVLFFRNSVLQMKTTISTDAAVQTGEMVEDEDEIEEIIREQTYCQFYSTNKSFTVRMFYMIFTTESKLHCERVAILFGLFIVRQM
jgi:hypothetical protein